MWPPGTFWERREAERVAASTPDLGHDIMLMATACWILITAFTARRDREVDELEADCLAGSDADGWWLYIYIEKTLRRKDWIPIPPIVARAVTTLLKISAAARKQMSNRLIFQYVAPASGKTVVLDVGRRLDDFAAAVGVPLHKPRGEPARAWHWSPHQLRRFFAVFYFYRFEGASVEALSHQLRHFNLEMTRRYVTQDKEAAAIWLDVEWGYNGHLARSIVAGERAVGGVMGDRLKKSAHGVIEQLRKKTQIVTPQSAGASVAMLMQRKALVLTPLPWVTCASPATADAARTATCRQGQEFDRSRRPGLRAGRPNHLRDMFVRNSGIAQRGIRRGRGGRPQAHRLQRVACGNCFWRAGKSAVGESL